MYRIKDCTVHVFSWCSGMTRSCLSWRYRVSVLWPEHSLQTTWSPTTWPWWRNSRPWTQRGTSLHSLRTLPSINIFISSLWKKFDFYFTSIYNSCHAYLLKLYLVPIQIHCFVPLSYKDRNLRFRSALIHMNLFFVFFSYAHQCDCPRETGLFHYQICRAHPWEVVYRKGKETMSHIKMYVVLFVLMMLQYLSYGNVYIHFNVCVLQFSNGWSFGEQMCEISKSHTLLKPYKSLTEKVGACSGLSLASCCREMFNLVLT